MPFLGMITNTVLSAAVMLVKAFRPGAGSFLATRLMNTKLTIAAVTYSILAVTSPIMIIFATHALRTKALAAACPLIAHIFRQQINDDEDAYTFALRDVFGDVHEGLRENDLMMVQINGPRIAEMVRAELRREREQEQTAFW